MKVAIFDAFSGMAGDMTVGAFLDAGFDFKILNAELKKLGIGGFTLGRAKVKRGHFSGTQFKVHIRRGHFHEHTHLFEIRTLIRKSRLHPAVKKTALAVFEKLGRAEARAHGVKLDEVAFHEVGAVDSIVDIVGAAVCLHRFGIEKIFVRNLHVGRGSVQTHHHGRMMVPSPGTLELLKGFELHHSPIDHEMVTPTGAAVLAALAEKTSNLPSLEVLSVGYGAGTANFKDRPNLLRVTVGEMTRGFSRDGILVLETNLDDMNPLGFEILYRRLFQAGALDVYVTPVLMKKMRPAYKLSVLLEHGQREKIAEAVFKETTTFGVRFLELGRFLLERKFVRVLTRYGKLKVKIGSAGGQTRIVSPEYRDCRRAALKSGLPFRVVYAEAKRRAEKLKDAARG